MATLLHRLGSFAFRRRWIVLLTWIAGLAVTTALATTYGESADAEFSVPGTESIDALELLDERFDGASAAGASARIVFVAPEGEKLEAYSDTIAEVVSAAGGNDLVVSATDPFTTGTIAPEGRIGFSTVTYTGDFDDITAADREDLVDAAELADDSGLRIELGGDATQAQSEQSAAEAVGVLVALLVLAVTFGSLLAAGMPLLTALIGVGAGMSIVTALSSVVDLTAEAPVLGLMLGLAVGIDYALFIASRHKQHLAEGMSAHESAALAVGTAGSAVVFAGATVMIALSGLTLVGIPFMTTMGLVAAGMVLVAVIVALTLVPAFLGFAGDRFNRWSIPGLRRRQERLATREPFGARWARFVTRRPWATVGAATAGLLLLAVPVSDLRLGLPDEGHLSSDTTQRQAFDLLAEGFGPGFNGPLIAVVDTSETGGSASELADRIGPDLADVDGVVQVTPSTPNEADDTATFTIIPDSGPSDAETEDLVRELRDVGGDALADGGDLSLTGSTAIGIDLSEKLESALPIFLIVVIGLSLLLLTLAFRSILVPLKATLGFLLSLAATFGALVAVFQWGWLAELIGVEQTGPIASFLPVMLVGLVFGLAMDYEVFLVSRMREDYVHGDTAEQAVINGARHGARVVTAAALIMGSVFAGFMLGGDPTIKSMGFALAFGVLIDAFVVRMTIVPAVMTLMGDRAWYLPRWLDRTLPNVDIEGTQLESRRAQSAAGAAESESRGVGVIG